MTALCGGGTSQPAPGESAVVAFGAGTISQKFSSSGNNYVAIFAGFLGTLTYILSDLCATDPPPMPVLSADDYINVVNFEDTLAAIASLNKFRDWFANLIWPDLCVCNNGTVVGPPAPVAPPANIINITNIISGAGVVGPCDTQSSVPRLIGTYGGVIEQELIPFNNFTGALVGSPTVKLAPSASEIIWTVRVTPAGVSHPDIYFELECFAASLLSTGLFNVTVSSGHTATTTTLVPANSAGFLIRAQPLPAGPTTDPVSASAIVYCGTVPGGAVAPCCPADQFTLAKLTRIEQMLTLIQRQSTPFGYIASTVHAGLSGAGTIAVVGLIGLKITLGALPPGAPTAPGVPAYLFDAGWVSVGTTDGYVHDRRVSSATQLWFPPDMGVMTVVGYAFTAAITATITELVREP